MEECGTARHRTHDNIIWRLNSEFCLEMATDTQSEIVERVAFPRQQMLHNRNTMLQLMLLNITHLFPLTYFKP
jgi:hypothetical protein